MSNHEPIIEYAVPNWKQDLYQVTVDGEPFGEPMPISDAHNYALSLKNISPNHEYDVIEAGEQ